MMHQIRAERPGDENAVFEVNSQAFGRKTEANLVDQLRTNCPLRVSLVAEQEGAILGHILFTPARIEDGMAETNGMGLAPLAVLPSHQRQGIGSALVRTGLAQLRAAGVLFVAVVGHPRYYPKFGFKKASTYGIRCEYGQVPDEAFMILVFHPQVFQGVRGIVRLRPEFAAAV